MNTQIQQISVKYNLLKGSLNEKARRLYAGAEVLSLGKGGVKIVMEATGMSHHTIIRGKRELENKESIVTSERIRKKGGGRRKKSDKDSTFPKKLEEIVESSTIGDPERVITWTSKSLIKLQNEMRGLGFDVSRGVIRRELIKRGYSLQAMKKTKEGSQDPNRNEQFEYINQEVKQTIAEGCPVISVDTKKKELIGDFKNSGVERRRKGKAIEANVYDYPNLAKGKIAPYGVYDIKENKGWVNVGISADTAKFAVESIKRRWKYMGKERYEAATKIFITADGGGSNSSRSRLWKFELQQFANEIGKEIHVSHYPPSTSKWNKIEHRMFAYISQNWRGRPLNSYQVAVNLIGSTRTQSGFEVKAILDETIYEKGIKISDEEFATIHLEEKGKFGKRNYKIKPDMAS